MRVRVRVRARVRARVRVRVRVKCLAEGIKRDQTRDKQDITQRQNKTKARQEKSR